MELGWHKVSVEAFKELQNLNRADYATIDDYIINKLSIASNVSIEELEDMTTEEYDAILLKMQFLQSEPNKKPSSYVLTRAGKLFLIDDFNSITIGEFIDLENLFTSGWINNLNLILAILYRQKTFKESLLFQDEYEPYGDWIYHREPLFDEVSINLVYGSIISYLKFREEFFKQYEGLVEENTGEIDEEELAREVSKMSVIERAEYKKAEQQEESLRKWNWDLFLYKLANRNPMNLEAATKIPLLQAMNVISMKKELNLPD